MVDFTARRFGPGRSTRHDRIHAVGEAKFDDPPVPACSQVGVEVVVGAALTLCYAGSASAGCRIDAAVYAVPPSMP